MRTKLILFIIFLAFVTPVFGKPRKGDKPPQPQPPSAHLSKLISAHLDRIPAPLDQQVSLPRNEVTQLRESFADEWSKAAQADKAAYQAAVCESLLTAIDESEKEIAAFNAVPQPSKQAGALHKAWVERRAQLSKTIDEKLADERKLEKSAL
jgi:hypothetical protein